MVLSKGLDTVAIVLGAFGSSLYAHPWDFGFKYKHAHTWGFGFKYKHAHTWGFGFK